MKILDVGDKIKKLRIELGLKQDDLASTNITRSLISMIENNKRNLTYKNAHLIAASLNKYYAKLGKEITPEFLLESREEQAERLINEEINKMQDMFSKPIPESSSLVESRLQELIDFAVELKLDSKIAHLHELKGEFYYDTAQYHQAIKNLFVAQEYYLLEAQYKKVARIYNIIAMSYYDLLVYEQALIYYERAQQLIKNYNLADCDRLNMHLCHNKILCYKKLKQYDLVFKEIARYRQLPYFTKEHHLNVLLVEANTFRDLNQYDKAVKIYDRMLTKHRNQLSELTPLVYGNYIDTLRRKGEYENSLEKVVDSLDYHGNSQPRYIADLYLSSAQLYFTLGNFDESINQIKQGLMLAKRLNNNDVLKFHLLHIKIQLENEHYSEAKAIIQQIQKNLPENEITEDFLDITLSLLKKCQ